MAALLVAGLTSGCTAQFVERRPRRAGPVPEVLLDPGGGHLQYSLRGLKWIVASRRNDAMAKMSEFCGGPTRYRVLDEIAREDASATYSGGELEEGDDLHKASRHYEFYKVQHLYFECAK